MAKIELRPICYYSLAILLLGCSLAEYVVQVDRFVFEPKDRESIQSQSTLIEQDGNRSYLSGHLYLNKPLENLMVQASLDISRPKFPRVRLFESKLDVCAFLNNAYKSKFVQQLHNRFVNFNDVRPRCPLQPHVNYTLRRSFVDESMLPELLPECTFSMKMDFLSKTKLISKMQVAGLVRPIKKGNKRQHIKA